MSFPIKCFMVLLLPAVCWCQQPSSDLTARTLFYEEPRDNDQLPSISAAKSAQARKATQTQSASAANASGHELRVAGNPSPGTETAAPTPKNVSLQSGSAGPSTPVVKHLGLRYNLLLVDSQSGQSEPVDSDRVFEPGECVQLEFEANRSGYLYVLDRGSSGTWKPLLPSPDMPEESNIISSRARVRVPQDYCFKIEGPPGVDQLFVALSRNPSAVRDLDESIRPSPAPATPPPVSQEATPPMTAELRLSHAVTNMEASMGSRDIKIAKIGRPKETGEPPGAVYVVNTSDVPSDQVITEIRIRHN